MAKPDFEAELHKHICHWVGGMPVVSVGAAFNMLEQTYAAGRAAERERCVGICQNWSIGESLTTWQDACHQIASDIKEIEE